jgi:hypothetical protein
VSTLIARRLTTCAGCGEQYASQRALSANGLGTALDPDSGQPERISRNAAEDAPAISRSSWSGLVADSRRMRSRRPLRVRVRTQHGAVPQQRHDCWPARAGRGHAHQCGPEAPLVFAARTTAGHSVNRKHGNLIGVVRGARCRRRPVGVAPPRAYPGLRAVSTP